MLGIGDLLSELRRRRVFRAAGLCIVGAWVVVQVASLIFPAINVPDYAIRYVWIALALLFPACLIFAWFFEITPDGLRRTPPAAAGESIDRSLRRKDYLILVALAAIALAVSWQLTGSISDISHGPALQGASDSRAPNSIAVLPLDNRTGDPAQRYFVSGMHDALIAGLARISELKVISKPSTLVFADSSESLPRIAARLGVASLVSGYVERAGDTVRIAVSVHDAITDEEIWSSIFERRIAEVLRLQDQVAQAIAVQVAGIVAQAPGVQTRTIDPAAYEAFLKGQVHVERFTAKDMMLAEQYFRQAVELDPDYALVHYGMFTICSFKTQAGFLSPDESKEQCMAPLVRALRLDPFLAEAHMGYAVIMAWHKFDFDEARAAFERAIELNPSYAEARMFFSHLLAITGEGEESSTQMAMARELDPLNPFVRGLHGVQRLMVGDTEGSIELLESSIASAPGFGHSTLWVAYTDTGQYDKAVQSALRVFEEYDPEHFAIALLEDAYTGDNYAGVMRQLGEALAESAAIGVARPLDVGTAFEFAGEVDRAIDWYETGYKKGDPNAPYIGATMLTPSVRAHPRFIALLREMNLDYWADTYSELPHSP